MLLYFTLGSGWNWNQGFAYCALIEQSHTRTIEQIFFLFLYKILLSELNMCFGAVRLGSHWTGHLLEECSTISYTITVPLIVGRLGKPILSCRLHFIVLLADGCTNLIWFAVWLQEGIRWSLYLFITSNPNFKGHLICICILRSFVRCALYLFRTIKVENVRLL